MNLLKNTTSAAALQALYDTNSEAAHTFDALLADAIRHEYSGVSKRRQMTSRYVVDPFMKNTLASMFPNCGLNYTDFENTTDGNHETLRSFLINTIFSESIKNIVESENSSIVMLTEDIQEVLVNNRMNVTLCPINDSLNVRVRAAESEARISRMFSANIYNLRAGSSVASISAYTRFMSDSTQFFTYVGNRSNKFDIVLSDCFHACLDQAAIMVITAAMGAKKAFMLAPYIPEVFLNSYSNKVTFIRGYDMTFDINEDEDTLIIRSVNSSYIHMKYGLTAYREMLYRKVLRVGNISAVFEQQAITGRFVFITMDIIPTGSLIKSAEYTTIPDQHSITFKFDDHVLYKRFKLKTPSSDVMNPASYEEVTFSAPKNAVNATIQYALRVKQDNFTARAIRLRLSSYVQRTVVGGTTLVFQDFVSGEDITGLVNWIFAKVFVMRFMAGSTLTTLQDNVKLAMERSDAGIASLVYAAMAELVKTTYDMSFGQAMQYMRDSIGEARIAIAQRDSVSAEPVELPTSLLVVEDIKVQYSRYHASFLKESDFSTLPQMRTMSTYKDNLNGLFKERRNAVRNRVQTQYKLRASDVTMFPLIDEKVAKGHDIVHTTDYIGFDVQEIVHQEDAPESASAVATGDYVTILNDAYREMYPEQYSAPMTVNHMIFEVSDYDLNFHTSHLEIRPFNSAPLKEKAYYGSKIQGPRRLPIQQTQRNTLQALNNRQMGPPDLDESVDVSALANQQLLNVLMRRFFVSFCTRDWEQKLAKADDTYFAQSYESLSAKLSKLEPHKIRKWAEADEGFEEMKQNVMKCMIKSVAKPPDAVGGHFSVDKSQTIIYDESNVATELGAIMKSCYALLSSLFRPEVLWMDQKSPSDISRHAADFEPYDPNTEYLEGDISRCDKSFKQYMLITLVNEIFRILRMNILVRYSWYSAMDVAKVRAIDAGIRLSLEGQVKSGTFATWFCNTFGVQMSFANSYQLFDVTPTLGDVNNFDVEEWFKSDIDCTKPQPELHVNYNYYYVMATGDDGLTALTRPSTVHDRITLCEFTQKMFNLEIKVITSRTPYFASGYLLVDDHERRVDFVANPIKFVEKKSYYQNASTAAWNEYWISMNDSLKPLGSVRVRQLLADAVRRRSGKPLPLIGTAIDALYEISLSKEKYRNLYRDDIIRL